MRVLGVAILVLSLQDPSWLEKCKGLDASKAESLRYDLGDLKDQTGLVRAVRAILVEAARRGPKGDAMLKGLSAHFDKVGAKPDLKQGLAAAMAGGGDEALWLALGYLEQLAAAGENPGPLAETAKKLKIKVVNGMLATEEGDLLAQMKKTTGAAEIERLAQKGGCPELTYTAVIASLKAADMERAGRLLTPLKRWSPDHIELLIDTVKQFKPCSACKGSKTMVCTACNGTKKRKIVCPECNGVGNIKWDPNSQKTALREQNDKILGLPKDRSYCPSCLGRPDVKEKVDDCKLCEMKGTVTCQKCRWQTVSLEAIGKLEPCKACAGSGFMFTKVQHPCAFCKGVGDFLVPLAAPEKKVGPVQ